MGFLNQPLLPIRRQHPLDLKNQIKSENFRQNLKIKMSATTFEEAVEIVNNKMNKTLSNDELKEIYALYKQATVGDINVDRPGLMSMDFKGKAKWDAWKSKEGMSQDDAKTKYMEYANEMVGKHGTSS